MEDKNIDVSVERGSKKIFGKNFKKEIV